MNKEEQRIAIAEACGWTEFERKNPMFFGLTGIKPCSDRQVVPDYLNDLNAMHEAEKVLLGEQMEKYCITLHTLRIDQGIPTHTDSGWRNLGMLHATAAQRAEAFLKTLNLWKETQ